MCVCFHPSASQSAGFSKRKILVGGTNSLHRLIEEFCGGGQPKGTYGVVGGDFWGGHITYGGGQKYSKLEC